MQNPMWRSCRKSIRSRTWPNGMSRPCGPAAKALEHLKKHKVEVEDPGNEIGPEVPGSPNMGLWFHDPDGYRWELSVLGGK